MAKRQSRKLSKKERERRQSQPDVHAVDRARQQRDVIKLGMSALPLQ